MLLMVIGLFLFIGIHVLPWHQQLRTVVVAKLGLNTYKGLFTLCALTGLIFIIVGKAYAEYQHLWSPPSWGKLLAFPLMFIALMLLPAANLPGNIKRLTRHPMLWAIVLWSVAHLSTNGDLASMVLFSSLGVYALLAMLSANKRGATRQAKKLPIRNDIVIVVIGLIVFTGLLFLHPYLFKVAII